LAKVDIGNGSAKSWDWTEEGTEGETISIPKEKNLSGRKRKLLVLGLGQGGGIARNSREGTKGEDYNGQDFYTENFD